MKYDLIIVSKSTGGLKDITQRCIDSASQDGADMNVIVVETSGQKVDYDATIVYYEGEFNYHRALNQGLKHASGDVYILANNDIIFYPGWSVIGEQMITNGYDSACAWSSDVRQKDCKQGEWIYPGYIVGKHVTGWCIFLTKECYQKIGQLDESVKFWYSDNIYADQLQSKYLSHGLFCNIRVEHMTSQTLKTLNLNQQREYSSGQQRRYAERKRIYKVSA